MANQPSSIIYLPLLWAYNIWQWLLDKLLSPAPPPPHAKLRHPRIAVIGAGLTGVSSAAHIVGHGFDVMLFEAGSRDHLGGIWTHVNTTSGLQINSIMYRFHPHVHWSSGYPKQATIVQQIRALWEAYNLEEKTKFNTPITSVTQVKSSAPQSRPKWIINNDRSFGEFDGIIAAVGTCGDPKRPHLEGEDKFRGQIVHSTELDRVKGEGKRIIIVGGGASAVEALEFAARVKAKQTTILARSEKWIIPRNSLVDIGLSMNVLGQENRLATIPEFLLRKYFYRDLEDISPPTGKGTGLFEETPMVNTEVLNLIRDGKAQWLRGDIRGYAETGIKFNRRAKGVPKNGPGHEELVEGDVVVMATGFKRPSLSFLPHEIFREPYMPPNWYLQTFPPDQLSICANNCTFVNAIGSVGNWHIGIYTRLLLMFLVDPLTMPTPVWSKRWIEMTKFLKHWSPGNAFDFFTYGELLWWFAFCAMINSFRWKWAPFVLFGIGEGLPMEIVAREEQLRHRDRAIRPSMTAKSK